MKYTVDTLITALQKISAEGGGSLPVWTSRNPVYSTQDIELSIDDPRDERIEQIPRCLYINVDTD